jgi:hypothetical protein
MANGVQQPVQPVQQAKFYQFQGPAMPAPIDVQQPWQPPAGLMQAPAGTPSVGQLAPPAQLPPPATYELVPDESQAIANYWQHYQPTLFEQAWHQLRQPGRSVQPAATSSYPMPAPL